VPKIQRPSTRSKDRDLCIDLASNESKQRTDATTTKTTTTTESHHQTHQQRRPHNDDDGVPSDQYSQLSDYSSSSSNVEARLRGMWRLDAWSQPRWTDGPLLRSFRLMHCIGVSDASGNVVVLEAAVRPRRNHSRSLWLLLSESESTASGKNREIMIKGSKTAGRTNR